MEVIARAVDIAARNRPAPASCLVRSLALERLLRQAGYAAHLRLGVQRTTGQLQGHAWVEVGGRVVGDAQTAASEFWVLEDWHAVHRRAGPGQTD